MIGQKDASGPIPRPEIFSRRIRTSFGRPGLLNVLQDEGLAPAMDPALFRSCLFNWISDRGGVIVARCMLFNRSRRAIPTVTC